MKLSVIADSLWGYKARGYYLFIASILLLFSLLGAREIWTQEHRWADIVFGMFYRHDFLHPYLGENRYYDKPLLSYWMIAFFAKLSGSLTTWALRLPSACAGLLAIGSICCLGTKLKDKQLGLLSGWLLLTTFYFVFWARTSSADMLNLAGSLFAVSWYIAKRHKAHFFEYTIFFIILAFTSLCKGLGGAIVPLIAVFVDICLQKTWQQHLRWPLFLGMIPALILYILPFGASYYFGGESYGQNGLYLVYRENILRYFHPFDHQGPFYTYFLYLPIYTLPWAIFFIPALVTLKRRWKALSISSRWIVWTTFALFLFFTLSGSRRSYYVLPIVPFAILFTADWILSTTILAVKRWVIAMVIFSFFTLFLVIDIIPAWYYAHFGVKKFAMTLKDEVNKISPWSNWHIVMLDAESKLNFYLQLSPSIKHYGVKGSTREIQTSKTLAAIWPILENKPPHTIFISRERYAPLLQGFFTGYRLVKLQQPPALFRKNEAMNAPVAFIPNE